jgi:putative molybdopterin biosynthesis protein
VTALHGSDTATSLRAWLDAVRAAGGLLPLPVETVPLPRAAGRVTARPIVARGSTPSYDAAAMDGIALAAAATAGAPLTLPPAAFTRVDTGDPLPPGTDAVVRREEVQLAEEAHLEREVLPFENVRQVGEDIAAGDLVFPAGRSLGPADLAVLASVGETAVTVWRRPVVAVLPTGDELVPLGAPAGLGEIVDTNSLMLAAMAAEAGGTVTLLPIVPDDPVLLEAALLGAAAAADLVLLLSGSAKGADDHTVTVLERAGEVVVQGVAVKPGHPVVLGHSGGTPLVGVPGYPVSAALAFELFAAPLLAELGGHTAATRPRVRAGAAAAISSTPHSDEWIRLRLALVGGELRAVPLRRGAGVLSSLARADGLACIPIGCDGVAEGDELEVELLRPLAEVVRALIVCGSTDPLLDALAAEHGLVGDGRGSRHGADALAAAHCHLALLTEADAPPEPNVLGRWERPVGLLVASGDPLGIGGSEGLARPEVRLVNRPPGSASRRLLDRLLAEQALDPERVAGYRREARSQAAAAAAVAAGAADCAVGSAAAAALHGLDLLPLVTETLLLVAAPGLEADGRILELRERLAHAHEGI